MGFLLPLEYHLFQYLYEDQISNYIRQYFIFISIGKTITINKKTQKNYHKIAENIALTKFPHLQKYQIFFCNLKFLIITFESKSVKMKANQQQFVPNKKLIIHFDIDGVLRLPSRKNKDLYVYDLCAGWVWGKLEKNSKEDPNKVTGWKLASNALTKQQPQPDTISYKEYLKQYVKPDANEWQNLILNLSKGPAAKAKGEIQKTIKNITIPKPLYDVLKQSKPEKLIEKQYVQTGKYEILPAFYKLFLSLKKNKREFSIIVKCDKANTSHSEIIEELNLFFGGEHPLYNGKNGTPLVKMDGTNKSKNFIFTERNFQVFYHLKAADQNQYIASFGTYNYVEEKDPDMLKQSLKSNKKIKVCQSPGDIHSYSHSILAESAFIYEINPTRALFIDQVDYLTHQIYFTTSNEANVVNVLGNKVQKTSSFLETVDEYQMLRDVDYFIKKVQKKQQQRALQIQRIQKGEQNDQAAREQNAQQGKQSKNQISESKQTDAEYLKRTIIPLLDGAFRQVDLFRPDDPIGFIALYCLKNKDLIK